MAHILLTAGPTRSYIDDVRYLTNASSGRMAHALATSALECGHDITIVSGPVSIQYPKRARVIPVVTTAEMLTQSLQELKHCNGVIAAAAPCDFEPVKKNSGKIPRRGNGMTVELKPTPDVIATLASQSKNNTNNQVCPKWFVAFALEPEADKLRACEKVTSKHCDLIVVNDLTALEASTNSIDVYNAAHEHIGKTTGSKKTVAMWLLRLIETQLMAC
ncbi:MAG: phosphopantothenoylcysteine decarboxylase [Pirellulales bacterium]